MLEQPEQDEHLRQCAEVSGRAGGPFAAAVGQGASLTVLQNLNTALIRPSYDARSAYDWKNREARYNLR